MFYNAKAFGHRLHQLRKQRGLTQEALGGALNITAPNISKYEAGSTTPTIEVIVELSEFFHVSLDYLALGRLPEKEKSREALLQLAEAMKKIALEL